MHLHDSHFVWVPHGAVKRRWLSGTRTPLYEWFDFDPPQTRTQEILISSILDIGSIAMNGDYQQ